MRMSVLKNLIKNITFRTKYIISIICRPVGLHIFYHAVHIYFHILLIYLFNLRFGQRWNTPISGLKVATSRRSKANTVTRCSTPLKCLNDV